MYCSKFKSRTKFIRKLARRVWPPPPPLKRTPFVSLGRQESRRTICILAAFEGYTLPHLEKGLHLSLLKTAVTIESISQKTF